MLKRVEGEVRSARPGVKCSFLFLFVVLRLSGRARARLYGGRSIVTGTTDVHVWETHRRRMAGVNTFFVDKCRVNMAKVN